MPYKDPIKQKEYHERYRLNNKERRKEQNKKYYEKNEEKMKESTAKRLETRKQYAIDSITSGKIIDQYQWDMWCKEIKRCAKNNKKPYSEDFTSDIMFEMMVQGCFYCGDIATTIDRIDSKLDHAIENCVGCCHGCNMSKGATDYATFIRKACYRVCGEYVDKDTNIWFVHKNKPEMWDYKYNANKQGVSFDLTKEDFDILTIDNCKYCKRSPTTWFGVDRVVPSEGYVLGNVVSCCFDCNLDKLEDDVESMRTRNERIVARVDAGELIIKECEKVILRTANVV